MGEWFMIVGTIANFERLYAMNWRRIILDEGHNIRNPNTKSCLAATALLAQSRWVLTGDYPKSILTDGS